MGYAGLIIALEQPRVKVKDGEKKLCKRWRVSNERQTLRFILFSSQRFLFTKGSWPVCDVLQSHQISLEKLMKTTLERMGLNIFFFSFSERFQLHAEKQRTHAWNAPQALHKRRAVQLHKPSPHRSVYISHTPQWTSTADGREKKQNIKRVTESWQWIYILFVKF